MAIGLENTDEPEWLCEREKNSQMKNQQISFKKHPPLFFSHDRFELTRKICQKNEQSENVKHKCKISV